MSILKFEKAVVPTTKGMQKSEYDVLLDEFKEGGDTLYWTEDLVPRQKAAQIAARLRLIGKGKKFHSGFDVVQGKAFVRMRPDGEVGEKDGEVGEVGEKEEDEEKEITTETDDAEKARLKAESLKELYGEDEPVKNEDPNRIF